MVYSPRALRHASAMGKSVLNAYLATMKGFCVCDFDSSHARPFKKSSDKRRHLSSYFATPAASHTAIALASASSIDCGGMGIGPQTPELPAMILDAR